MRPRYNDNRGAQQLRNYQNYNMGLVGMPRMPQPPAMMPRMPQPLAKAPQNDSQSFFELAQILLPGVQEIIQY